MSSGLTIRGLWSWNVVQADVVTVCQQRRGGTGMHFASPDEYTSRQQHRSTEQSPKRIEDTTKLEEEWERFHLIREAIREPRQLKNDVAIRTSAA